MDYHSLKRKELQALCKRHNIPANSANSVLADKLSALLNVQSYKILEEQKPITRQRTCMKSTTETTDESEPASSKREKKKVRFSPSNDLVEYELRSGEKQKDTVTQIKARRKSVAKKVEKPVVDNNANVELVDNKAQVPVKLTRSSVQSLEKDVVIPNNVKKQSRRGTKGVEKETDTNKETEVNVHKVTRSKAHTLKIDGDNQHEESGRSKRVKDAEKESQSIEENAVSRGRVTRSKAQNLIEGGTGLDVNIKKKRGKQVETSKQDVESSKEVIDVPVKTTRSTRQTLKEDDGNVVNNQKADKKRTRKEMKATDLSLSDNTSHVGLVDKKEPPKRKSSRTKEVETVVEDEVDKVKVVNVDRVTRSKAPLEMEASGRNTRNKAKKLEIQQPEEPSKHTSKKIVNRRKPVLQAEKTETEPVNCGKNTRRKSVVQKVTQMVESPTVGKKQSKGQSGNLPVNEGEDDENVIRSGKNVFENESKEAVSGSSKSRKRRGTPIIEDQILETEYVSPVVKSPKTSTRSGGKILDKTVAKEQVDSSLKKSVSRINNQSSVENASDGKSHATRSGVIVRDSNSKKRAKLSETKQSDSEDHNVNFSKEETPVADTGKLKLDEKVNVPEVTPAVGKSGTRFTRSAIKSERKEPIQSAMKEKTIADTRLTSPKVVKFTTDPAGMEQSDLEDHDGTFSKEETPVANTGKSKHDEEVTETEVAPAISKSNRRFTRSAIKTERKEPNQSVIKEQPIADNRLTSPKVAKVRPDPAVNTAPGRITRRGIKHGGNTSVSFSEKVGKAKQKSQSAHKKQSVDDAQMASPEVQEVGPVPDIGTEGVSSEIKQLFDEAHMSSPEVAEVGPNPDVGTKGILTGIKQLFDEAQMSSPEVPEVWPNPDVGTKGVLTGIKQLFDEAQMSSPEVPEVGPVPDVGTEGVSSEIKQLFDEDQMSSPEVAEDLANPDGDTAGAGSETSKEVTGQTLVDVSGSESVRSPTKVVENMDPASGIAIDMENTSSKENASGEIMEVADSGYEKSIYDASATPCFDDGTQIKTTSVSTADVETAPDAVSDGSHVQDQNEVAHVESGILGESVNLEISVPESERPEAKEKAIELTELGSPSKELQTDVMIEDTVVADGVNFQEVDSVVGDYDVNSNRVDTPDRLTVDNKLQGNETEVGVDTARDSIVEHSEPSTGINVNYDIALEGSDVADDTGKQVAKEHETEVVPSTSENIHDIPVFGKSDGEDDNVDAVKESEIDLTQSPACDMIQDPMLSGSDGEDDGVTTNEKDESNSKQLPDIDANDASLLGQEPSSGNDIIKTPFSGSNINEECDNTISDQKSRLDINTPKELETGSELSNANNTLEVPVSHIDVDIGRVLDDNMDAHDGESEHDQLTSNNNPATNEENVGGDDSEPAQNEGVNVVAEDLVRSHDQEPEQLLNVAVDDDVFRDTVGESDSARSEDTPKTLATNGNDDLVVRVDAQEESVLDINKDVVSSILGDTYDIDVEDDHVNEQKLTEPDEVFQPKESETESPVDGTDSDLPTIKEDDSNTQEETQNANTFVDWGDYDFGMDDFDGPVSADASADVAGKGQTDYQYSNLQNSVGNLEKGSTDVADRSQVNDIKVGTGDSSLKSLSATPASCVKDRHDDAFNQDSYSALKSLFTTPATTHISRVKSGQEEAVDFANQDHSCADLSLKTLFKTPVAPQSSHVKVGQEDAISLANQDPYASLRPLFATSTSCINVNDRKACRSNEDIGASHEFNHQWEVDHDQSKGFDRGTQGNEIQDPENDMYGVLNLEDDPLKLFGDKEVGDSIDRSARNTHFEFKGDQVDQIKQFEFLSEASGTSNLDPSGFKDDSNHTQSQKFRK